MESYFRNGATNSDGRRVRDRSLSRSEREFPKFLQKTADTETDDLRLDRKTKQLFGEWQRIERRAEELRKVEVNNLFYFCRCHLPIATAITVYSKK